MNNPLPRRRVFFCLAEGLDRDSCTLRIPDDKTEIANLVPWQKKFFFSTLMP